MNYFYLALESAKQEEIAKAIFAESEKYERVLASLRADLKNQDAIKAKVAEMDRIIKGTDYPTISSTLTTFCNNRKGRRSRNAGGATQRSARIK